MIRTHGLNHISLAVRDPERSLAFYEAVFGVEEYYRDDTNIQAKGNGTHDIFAFERDEFAPGYPYAYVFDPDGYEIEIWFE